MVDKNQDEELHDWDRACLYAITQGLDVSYIKAFIAEHGRDAYLLTEISRPIHNHTIH